MRWESETASGSDLKQVCPSSENLDDSGGYIGQEKVL